MSSALLDLAPIVALALLAIGLALAAAGSLGLHRRLRCVPTRRAAELSDGPAEVAGTLRPVDRELRTLEGTPAIAVRNHLTLFYRRSEDEAVTIPAALDVTECVPVEVTDASGTCELLLDHVVLIGPRAEATYPAADFARDFPTLWDGCRKPGETAVQVETVRLEQVYVPAGVPGFISGTAAREGSAAPGEGYRGTGRRFVLRGTDTDPLILSAWDERAVARYLRQPALLLGGLALVCGLSAVALLVLHSSLAALVR